MKKIVLIFLIALLCTFGTYAQEDKKSFLVMSYNVENLFDTINHPDFEDDAYTPAGQKAWTYDRYKKKLNDLGRVIMSLPEKELPAIIGLCEVENKQVLEDLVRVRGVRKADYEIIHEDGKDVRGIDCAMLYRPGLFKYKHHEYIGVEDPTDPDYRLREILYVTGNGPDGKLLHVFINHWKSRSGGQRETEKKRMFTAITLRKQLDLILSRDQDFRVIIMGDFNDEPTNRSIANGLSAGGKRKNNYMGDQYNLFYDLHNLKDMGTYNFRGNWNMLDQVIVSYQLLNQKKGLSTGFDEGKILKVEWMLYENERYGMMLPSATYGGPNYYGGPSDHLPVYVNFTY